jgi:hypothetical protein
MYTFVCMQYTVKAYAVKRGTGCVLFKSKPNKTIISKTWVVYVDVNIFEQNFLSDVGCKLYVELICIENLDEKWFILKIFVENSVVEKWRAIRNFEDCVRLLRDVDEFEWKFSDDVVMQLWSYGTWAQEWKLHLMK